MNNTVISDNKKIENENCDETASSPIEYYEMLYNFYY